jgi:hypothetical protein
VCSAAVKLKLIARKGWAVHTVLHQVTTNVLGLLSRARHLFGGDTPAADPPAFVAPPDLEDDLGRGWF